jgi:Flp pilus assembly protein TadD
MDPHRSSQPGDARGKPGPRSGAAGGLPFSRDTQDGGRLTVQQLEQQLHPRSGTVSGGSGEGAARRRSRSRSRSRRRGDLAQSGGRLLWFSIFIVVAIYLAVLFLNTLSPDKKKAKATAPAKPAASAAASVASVPEPVLPAVRPVTGEGDDGPPVTETVATLRRAQSLATEGRRLLRDRQYAPAEMKFEEAAALSPYVFDILNDWAVALREQKRIAAARDVYLRALAVQPEAIPVRIALAELYAQLGRHEDALELARWVLEKEAYSEEAHQLAAEAYTSKQDYTRAASHWQKLVALNANNQVARNKLGDAQLKTGQLPQAIRTFEGIIRDDPGNSQAYYYLAVAFMQRGEADLAVDVLSRASARFGQQFVVAWTRSRDFDALRDHDRFTRTFGGDLVAREAPVTSPPPAVE